MEQGGKCHSTGWGCVQLETSDIVEVSGHCYKNWYWDNVHLNTIINTIVINCDSIKK